jgi:hypothetical protein
VRPRGRTDLRRLLRLALYAAGFAACASSGSSTCTVPPPLACTPGAVIEPDDEGLLYYCACTRVCTADGVVPACDCPDSSCCRKGFETTVVENDASFLGCQPGITENTVCCPRADAAESCAQQCTSAEECARGLICCGSDPPATMGATGTCSGPSCSVDQFQYCISSSECPAGQACPQSCFLCPVQVCLPTLQAEASAGAAMLDAGGADGSASLDASPDALVDGPADSVEGAADSTIADVAADGGAGDSTIADRPSD